jgi:hypothetical protein
MNITELKGKLEFLEAFLVAQDPKPGGYLKPWLKFSNLPPSRAQLKELNDLFLEAVHTCRGRQYVRTRGRGSRQLDHFFEVVNKIKQQLQQLARQDYARRNHLTIPKRPGNWCAHEIAGTRCSGESLGCLYPPGFEHLEVFYSAGTIVRVIAQPYLSIEARSIDDLRSRLESWASGFGLSVRIAPEESWHFPGHTILYELGRKHA